MPKYDGTSPWPARFVWWKSREAFARWRLENPGATWPLDVFKAGWNAARDVQAGAYIVPPPKDPLEAINGRLA